jgi:hypothetical protein
LGVSFVDKYGALRRHKVVPVICDECGQRPNMPRPNERTRDALIQTGYYRGFVHELEMLERTERLSARFSNSRHPLIAGHLHLRPSEVPTAADEGFERALREDAELHEFLTRCGFLLPARLKVVRQSLESDEPALRRVRNRPVGIDDDRTVRRRSSRNQRDRIAVRVGVVPQHVDRLGHAGRRRRRVVHGGQSIGPVSGDRDRR